MTATESRQISAAQTRAQRGRERGASGGVEAGSERSDTDTSRMASPSLEMKIGSSQTRALLYADISAGGTA